MQFFMFIPTRFKAFTRTVKATLNIIFNTNVKNYNQKFI